MKAHLSTEDDIIAENDDLGRMAALLQASCDFRVLQRLKPRSIFEPRDGSPTRRALLVDVETTGLDPKSDEVIELALLPVVYGLDGRIFEVGEAFVNLRQPTRQIPAAVTVLTGITDEMVVGKKLDLAKAVALIAEADLIIAHNAAFDRKFVEKLIGDVAKKPWACSMADVDWAREGYEGSKLAYLAMRTGFFFEGHRAADDCFAAVEILAQQLPSTGRPAMEQLLDRSRRTTWRAWADGAPFECKSALKSRGYSWNGDAQSGPRCWFCDVEKDGVADEVEFLRGAVRRSDFRPIVEKRTAYERFSTRRRLGAARPMTASRSG